MILVDIYVPSIDQEFDFGLDDTAAISNVIDEVASLVSQKEQCDPSGNLSELILCSMQNGTILPRDKTLEECGIVNGCRLILV